MTSMLREVGKTDKMQVNVDAIKSEIRVALINQKANACPMAVRLAWHAAGTFDKRDQNLPGGCNGGRMRFAPEATDPDNAGLSIIRDLLLPVCMNNTHISRADMFALAGCVAIEFLGGPSIPFHFGRSDEDDGKNSPPNGRLPDGLKGADHLREVFGARMGFSDREIVALSGAHTLGRCHISRSGFDGKWTSKPLSFDNEFFKNLLNLTWKEKEWNGKRQFEDQETKTLMMLPSDMVLVQDESFKVWVELYAKDEKQFFIDFANAFARLLALGCPAHVQPEHKREDESKQDKLSAEFREHAMHGSVDLCRRAVADGADPLQLEATSGRSALHKGAFWGHTDVIKYLLTLGINVDIQDHYGDSALHDAARFGNTEVVKLLLDSNANANLKNRQGQTPMDIAKLHEKKDVQDVLRSKL